MTPAQSEELKAAPKLSPREQKILQMRKYRLNNPHKIVARRACKTAMKRGELIRQPCEKCGDGTSEAHHEDYSRPLDVRWFCKKRHSAHHRKTKTHCANGHPWSPETIYVMPNGKRQYCVTCRQIRHDNRLDRMAEMKKLTKENLALSEEVKAAYSRIERLEADLLECQEFLDGQVDVVDGDYGEPSPNRAMQLHSMISETLNGPGGF